MMSRFLLTVSGVIGVAGSAVIISIGKPHLMIGWWAGLGLGILNFIYLLKTMKPSGDARKTQITFFLRYVALAGAFFLLIQLGRDQLGSSVVGFVSLYLALFVEYLFRLKKQK